MTARALAAQHQAPQEQYLGPIASTPVAATDQIASAKALLDSGAITQAEFEHVEGQGTRLSELVEDGESDPARLRTSSGYGAPVRR